MPGILCSVYDPTDVTVELKWRHGLELVRHHPEHVREQYSEPGFQLACVYHPEVCQGPRILVTKHFVLACYGNIYEDEWAQVADGEPLCRVLLNAFIARGINALKHLNGRYDIVVWDRHCRVLHLVSDRFGTNRHYYLRRPGALYVACEVKALAVFLDSIQIDPAGLASMLSFGYHLGNLTILKGVRCLINARILEYQAVNDHLKIDRYWNYPYGEIEPLKCTEEELAEALHGHLATALKRQLRGVDKILLPISGGLDSRTLAGLLHQSNFSGEILAYSFGQRSSRDVRYGRAIARKLGYRHITIPTPSNFLTSYQDDSAWRLDGEWTSELAWARQSHTHPALGNFKGFVALSGLYGDPVHGDDTFGYRRRAGDDPLSLLELRKAFLYCATEYQLPEEAVRLFQSEFAEEAEQTLNTIIDDTLAPLMTLCPYIALLRTEFEHRQRRHTAIVAQSLEQDIKAITPFLDREFVDFTLRIPFPLFHGKVLYKQMIRHHLKDVASIPYAVTGLPLTKSPLREALKWRADALLAQIPSLQRLISKRNAFFSFHQGTINQRTYFLSQINLLDYLSPPLDGKRSRDRYNGLLSGLITPPDQVCAFLPPAIFMRELINKFAKSID